MKKYQTLLLCLCFIGVNRLSAQTENDSIAPTRYVTRSTLYGIGYTNLLDTYLSPSEYTGVEFRMVRENLRMTHIMDGKVSSQTLFQIHGAFTNNHADSGNELSALASYSYALHYHCPLSSRIKLLLGPYGQINGGFIYNTRNGNNPAQGKAYLNLGASAMAIWKFQIGNRQALLRYQANLPLAGLMFSPDYQQSYYEIFTQGNHDHVIQFTSVHNQPSIHQMLTFDLPIRSTTLRLGYLFDIHQSKVNQIKCHTYSHVFMFGFVKNLYILKNRDSRASKNLPLSY